jgi:hypothetical protein
MRSSRHSSLAKQKSIFVLQEPEFCEHSDGGESIANGDHSRLNHGQS